MFTPTNTGIYIIESPSGKIYVGQSRNLKDRIAWYSHYRAKNQVKLYHSLKKHGWEAHQLSVIMPLREDINQDTLNWYEQFFMDYYRNQGIELLNIREGGAKGRHSKETKEKMSVAAKGRTFSEETRQKMRIAAKGRIISNETRKKLSIANKGRIKSPEECKNMSISRKGKKVSEETKMKISLSKKGFGKGKKLSAEHIKKGSDARRGQKRSEESKQRMRLARNNYLAQMRSAQLNVFTDKQ